MAIYGIEQFCRQFTLQFSPLFLPPRSVRQKLN